jgi:hypothetical protein
MKALFLDIDGVLNDCIAPGMLHWNSTMPHCVSRLNSITQRTGAKIFLISSWVDDPLFAGQHEKLQELLESRGVTKGTIVGFRADGTTKEQGIKQILTENDEIEDFIVIDDNISIISNGFMRSRQIKTESLVGLQEQDVEKAVAMLSE